MSLKLSKTKEVTNMKLDKEYPATHSMSTAWYIADEEGNVGILKFDDNGPVPYGVGDNCVEELVFRPKKHTKISLEDDQIYEIIGNPLVGDIKSYFCILQIDPQRTEEFFSLAKMNKHFIRRRISKHIGLYVIDTSESLTRDKKIKRDSLLDKIIKAQLIQAVYENVSLSTNNEFRDGYIEFTKDFESLPYYFYAQPYYTTRFLCRLLHEPKHPVTIDQMPKELRSRIIHIPVKFKDTQVLQIARWAPCTMEYYMGNTIIVDDCRYTLLPYDQTQKSYFLMNRLTCISPWIVPQRSTRKCFHIYT